MSLFKHFSHIVNQYWANKLGIQLDPTGSYDSFHQSYGYCIDCQQAYPQQNLNEQLICDKCNATREWAYRGTRVDGEKK